MMTEQEWLQRWEYFHSAAIGMVTGQGGEDLKTAAGRGVYHIASTSSWLQWLLRRELSTFSAWGAIGMYLLITGRTVAMHAAAMRAQQQEQQQGAQAGTASADADQRAPAFQWPPQGFN